MVTIGWKYGGFPQGPSDPPKTPGSVEGRGGAIYAARLPCAEQRARGPIGRAGVRETPTYSGVEHPVDAVISPFILYGALALGAFGVALALPKGRPTPQAIGGLLAAIAFGVIVLALTIKAGADRPNVFFYIFGFIALAASLRVITHPRPVYAALSFIFTILSSAGMFLLLAAEFMTFAIVIIYAGAILITYLFVIMLATQTPSAESPETLSQYDGAAREPIISTVVGFALLAALTGMIATGTPRLPVVDEATAASANPDLILRELPRKVQRSFASVGLADNVYPFQAARDEPRDRDAEEVHASVYRAEKRQAVLRIKDVALFNARVAKARAISEERAGGEREDDEIAALIARRQQEAGADGSTIEDAKPLSREAFALIISPFDQSGAIPVEDGEGFIAVRFPEDLRGENIEMVGFALLKEHPMAIELAGVILLLAMVGAVILARKQIEAGEAHAHTIGEDPSMIRRVA